MGEIADMMLDGTLDYETGEYIGDAVGYPRRLGFPRRRRTISPNPQSKAVNGVWVFLNMRGIKSNPKKREIIMKYCKEELEFEGKLTKCCEEIQKNWEKFKKYVKKGAIRV